MSPTEHIHISLDRQLLIAYAADGSETTFAVSTALNGAGEQNGSGCTPLGRHYIRARIGEGEPPGTVFIGRRPTGEIYTSELGESSPGRDWILSRILWLCGMEPGVNRSGKVDSMRRFIYIHGTPDSEPMGTPLSHGCVRMRMDEVIVLFDSVRAGVPVTITP
ncbi:L,D-transpeptidase family protein [Marinobacter sp. 1Y8]